ncbi:MAG TPA: hypothetical protein VII92_19915, partial [Anaerolineae bacterium]
GQTVQVKVMARYDNDAVYSRIPLEWDVIVRLRDARDNVVAARTLHVNEYGTLNTAFDLAEGGTVGAYHIETQIKNDVQRQAFKVEEYRKPEYEVTIHADRANIVNGDPVNVTVDVRTYFGAPVANATVELATYIRSYDWWWYSDEEDSGAWTTLQNQEATGQTDAEGHCTMTFSPRAYEGTFNTYRHSIPAMFEATVKDGSGQAVSAQAQVTLHDSAVGLSVSMPQHAYKPADVIPIRVMAHDVDGRPRVNEPVVVEVTGWSRSGYDQVIARVEGRTSAEGSALLNVKVDQQGWYEVHVSAPDRTERSTMTTDWLWVYDPDSASPWYMGDTNGLQISADKTSYVSGETAQLLIRTPVD